MRRNSRALLCMLLLVSVDAIAQSAIRPGLWEISQRTEIGGKKQTNAPLISRFCIDAQQADNPRAWTPRFHSGTACSIRDYVLQGNEANWNFTCQGEPVITGTGRLHIKPEQYEGSNNVDMRRGEERMSIVQSYAARRLGDCEGPTSR
ncbi:MAG TPA: DUF3617 family protein [Burkholderiales bacterium]|nr:DUF3617 family protein [Burkholderiales bacterium]